MAEHRIAEVASALLGLPNVQPQFSEPATREQLARATTSGTKRTVSRFLELAAQTFSEAHLSEMARTAKQLPAR